MSLFKRLITPFIISALKNMPAVFLNGPRQAGKSTLIRTLCQEKVLVADYFTLDEASTLAWVKQDPKAFIESQKRLVVIDEAQLAPELFRIMKQCIDELRLTDKLHSNGRFLLTGSANILALPALSDALVGRIEIITLWPLSASEVLGHASTFITQGFTNQAMKYSKDQISLGGYTALEKMMLKTTFPELANKDINDEARERWLEGYITTLLQRDIRFLAEIEKVQFLPTMLKLLAIHVTGLLNDAALARDLSLNTMTYRRYRVLLEALFLIIRIPPWYRNVGKRLVKSPKLYFSDTVLLCHMLGVTLQGLKKTNPKLFGIILENFVFCELIKQLTASKIHIDLYHFRTQEGVEVDFVLEKRNGELLGIEVKSKNSVGPEDFEGLKTLKFLTDKDFIRGIVLYCGDAVIPFGDRLVAMPIASLWH